MQDEMVDASKPDKRADDLISTTDQHGGASTKASGTAMTDLEMTKLCAEAMGYEAVEWSAFNKPSSTGMAAWKDVKDNDPPFNFDPLQDESQAMALVRTLGISIGCLKSQSRVVSQGKEPPPYDPPVIPWWKIEIDTGICYETAPAGKWYSRGAHLNRAIVECVAKMQFDRTASRSANRGKAE